MSEQLAGLVREAHILRAKRYYAKYPFANNVHALVRCAKTFVLDKKKKRQNIVTVVVCREFVINLCAQCI